MKYYEVVAKIKLQFKITIIVLTNDLIAIVYLIQNVAILILSILLLKKNNFKEFYYYYLLIVS